MGLIDYIRDVRGEMRHVSWPTRRQAIVYTALVLGVSAVTAVYLGLLDFVFSRLLERII